MRLCEEHRLGGVKGCGPDQCVGCVIETALGWEDVKDEWTDDIKQAFPTRSGSHEEYAVAMKMVGHRHSKGELVALVNWLLVRIKTREEAALERQTRTDR
jgi:hypothetical protein